MLNILKNTFGYNAFRPGQEEIAKNIINGKDILAVMPTGAGKSICYQVPAIKMEGITIVVSPLISLMIDQVKNLIQCGVRAAYLNSALTQKQYFKALDNARKYTYKIIYVSPERLTTDSFISFAKSVNISMVAVDEEDGRKLHIKLSTERDVADWEYSAIYDYYDTDSFNGKAQVIDADDDYNPVWELVIDYVDDIPTLEEKVAELLAIHKKEIEDVFETIKDKESEYTDGE